MALCEVKDGNDADEYFVPNSIIFFVPIAVPSDANQSLA